MQSEPFQRQRTTVVWYALWAALLLFLSVLRFLNPYPLYLATFYDDFYYYLVCAQNLVTNGIASFDGTTPTNGYHPFWFCIITALVWLFGGKPLGIGFFLAVSVLIAALTLWTFHAARTLLVTLKVPPLYAMLLSALVSIGAYRLGRGGMEVSLTIPLSLVLINRLVVVPPSAQSFKQLFATGLLTSALVLSRLDAALLPITYVSLLLCAPKQTRISLRKIAAWALGAVLIPLYLVFNKLTFGLWLTSSALAKQLKTDSIPRFDIFALHELALHPQAWTDGPSIYWCFNLSILFPTYVALLMLAHRLLRQRLNLANHSHLVCCATLLFPLIFILTQRASSGWLIWFWYLYPFMVSTTCAFALAYPWFQHLRSRLVPALILTQICALTVGSVSWHAFVTTEPGMEDILQEALVIAEFSQTHPGVYARGDRAGLMGYLLEYPVVQAEGLLMDSSYIESIRAERDLVTVLKEHGVQYYVATRIRKPEHLNGCYTFTEPDVVQSGAYSRKLQGQLCQEPLSRYFTNFGTSSIFSLQRSP